MDGRETLFTYKRKQYVGIRPFGMTTEEWVKEKRRLATLCCPRGGCSICQTPPCTIERD